MSDIWPFTQPELDAALARLSKFGASDKELPEIAKSIVRQVSSFARGSSECSDAMRIARELSRALDALCQVHPGDTIGRIAIERAREGLADFALVFRAEQEPEPGSSPKRGRKLSRSGAKDLAWALAVISRGACGWSEPNHVDWKFVQLCTRPLERLGLWRELSTVAAPDAVTDDLKKLAKSKSRILAGKK